MKEVKQGVWVGGGGLMIRSVSAKYHIITILYQDIKLNLEEVSISRKNKEYIVLHSQIKKFKLCICSSS